MGAKANQSKVELMVDYAEYFRRVGAVKDFYELVRLGLTGHDFSGIFCCSSLPMLKNFVKDHPKYHIVSSVGKDRFVNRLSEDADTNGYLIAEGDRDPALELNFLLDPQWPLIYEEGMAAAIAELNNIKNSRKS
ncbi:MAG: hypothetical protein FJ146_19920 [Deltaproteobacteria bacterium]|nr:hypothetical protein [Deltaproteobacteria bacterium]